MAGHFFISYSRVDGQEFALNVADEIEAGPEGYRVWLDQREMRGSRQDWDDQLVEAIQRCECVLFVMTTDSVRVGSGCKDEWVWALRYKKPVIPIQVDAGAELPFRLGSRQFIDFGASFTTGIAQLRRDLRWMATPEGQLRELEIRRHEAERELPRTPAAQQSRIEHEIEQLDARIEEQRRLVDNPQEIADETEARIGAALQREREPERPTAKPPRARFVNPPPLTAPTYFQNRHVETELIGDFLRDDGLRMLWIVGRGGVGKTAMVCRLLKALEAGRLPDDLGDLAVDGIVYLSPLGVHPVDFAHMVADLCRLLPQDVAEAFLERSRDPQETPAALMGALLEHFPPGCRCVLLLDNFEDVVDAEGVGLTDSALEEALVALLRAPEHGVKVVVTTRLAPRQLLLNQPGVQRRLHLDEGLGSPHAERVLRAMDADGTLDIKDAPDELLTQARERTRGFPRALEALVAILAADRDTTLPELLAATGSMPGNVIEALVGEAFNRLDKLAKNVVQALAVYPAPVPPVAVDYLLQPFQPGIDSAPVLRRLVNMQFVRSDAGRYYLHQVDRDYASERIPAGEPSDRYADPPPFSRPALRERAAEYFQQTRTPRETWRTLDDLAAQLAEFELRVQGDDHDAAAAILVAISDDYLQLWGHVRLARDLHERLADGIADPWTEATNLFSLGNAYSVLAEVGRAIGCYERALKIFQDTGDRQYEAGALNSLGNAHDVLGDIQRAIAFYEQAVRILQETGNRYGEGSVLGNLGNEYLSLGEVQRAIAYFEQALEIDREAGDRTREASDLSALGGAYGTLGDVRRAISFYDEALAILRETGGRRGEGATLDRLGTAYGTLGDERAIGFYEQALGIYREIGDQSNEGGALGNLGIEYAARGEVRRAIALYEQALGIFRLIGRREAEALSLLSLADAYSDLGDWPQAVAHCEEGVRIADDIGLAMGSSNGRAQLAVVQLLRGDYAAAQEHAQAARSYNYLPASDNLAVALGIALTRQGLAAEARTAFHEALNAADRLLDQAPGAYDEHDSRALALSGLALLEDPARLGEADEAFRAARAITCADGVVAAVLRLFDVLAMSDETGMLARVRPAAAGQASDQLTSRS